MKLYPDTLLLSDGLSWGLENTGRFVAVHKNCLCCRNRSLVFAQNLFLQVSDFKPFEIQVNPGCSIAASVQGPSPVQKEKLPEVFRPQPPPGLV